MFIPRTLYSNAYTHLKTNAHPNAPSILILPALDTDSLCATKILTHLLKRDCISHNLHPVAGYRDLEAAHNSLIKGNDELRFVVCIGLGGLVDLQDFLGWGEGNDDVEFWVIDARRPWNLGNVFTGGGKEGKGRSGLGHRGGVKVWDDGDIELELAKEGEAYARLSEMPEVDDEDESDESDDDDGGSDSEDEPVNDLVGNLELSEESGSSSRKRKSSESLDSDSEGSQRARRRRLGSEDSSVAPSSPPPIPRHTLLSLGQDRGMPSSPPPLGTPRTSPPPELPPPAQNPAKLRRKLRRLRQKHQRTVAKYYSLGTWYGEPVSSILYSLASELGREDNDILWLAIVGVSANELYGRRISSMKDDSPARENALVALLRDEVRRLNPPALLDSGSAAPTSSSLHAIAKGPNDRSIRLSPEFRFMLIRHWSLYDSMLHSSYLGTKLRLYSEHGKKKLHKLLAKMGFSLVQCRQTYTHMDMDLKRSLRDKIQSVSRLYGLEELVKDSFVRSWGWKAVLSAADVGTIVGSILEIGRDAKHSLTAHSHTGDRPDTNGENLEEKEEEEWVLNWFAAWDALENVDLLKSALPSTLQLHRALLATATALIEKRQIRQLNSFRMAVLKEGPDLGFFQHPSALTKLALWVAEAIYEQEREERRKRHLPLVVACLNEKRDVYVVVGVGICKGANRTSKAKEEKRAEKAREKAKAKAAKADNLEDEDEDEETEEEDSSDEEDDPMTVRAATKNRFGIAFQEVAANTNARIRIDSFEACVVEVKREDLVGFFEELSRRVVIGA